MLLFLIHQKNEEVSTPFMLFFFRQSVSRPGAGQGRGNCSGQTVPCRQIDRVKPSLDRLISSSVAFNHLLGVLYATEGLCRKYFDPIDTELN